MNLLFDESSVNFVLEALGFSVSDYEIWEGDRKGKCFFCMKDITTHDLAGILNLEGAALCCKRPECMERLSNNMK